MLHSKLLIGVDAVILIHELVVETSVETIVLKGRVLLVLAILIDITSHHCWVVITIYVFLEWSGGTTLHLGCFYFLGVVRAIAAVSCTTSHFLTMTIK